MSKIEVGCAPIAWVNDDMPSLGAETTYQQILSEVALAGYKGTEIGNKYPKDPAVLKRELDLRGIRIAAAWFSAFLTTGNFEEEKSRFIEFRDFLHYLGADCINIAEQGRSIQGMRNKGVFADKPSFSDEEWERLTIGLNELGSLANEKGMRLCYHHHMGTGVQTTEEIDRLMGETDPSWVYLLLDVGHLKFSGEDPSYFVDKYLDRIGHVHLKDVRMDVVEQVKRDDVSFLDAILAGAFTVPGDGATDFKAILQPVIDSDYEGWFLVEAEQDPAVANPLEYAMIARAYLADQLGV